MSKRRYFGTDGIRGTVGQFPINPEFVLKLGWAVGRVLARDRGGRVLIGKDTRVSGYMFESALEAGLSAAGLNIHLLGPLPTPAIAYLTRTQRARAGIVISASHNSYQDNGIKFFSSKGYKLDDGLELEIERLMDQPMSMVSSEHLGKAVRIDDAPGRYIEFCKSTIGPGVSFEGVKIVMDCANGATYQVSPSVFTELGAEVIEISTAPNGFNINEQCGSTHPNELQKRVVEEKADLGIAFDGDGDRVVMVDHKGRVVDGDVMLYIIAKYKKDIEMMDGGVVGTTMTNMGLEAALNDLNIPFVRTDVGDRYVIEGMLKQGWAVGGEQSGHIICLHHTTTGDGTIAALQVLSALCFYQKPLADIAKLVERFPQVLINVKVKDKDKALQDPQLLALVAEVEKELGDEGRVLLRKSGTESLIRVMVEGSNQQQIDQCAERLAGKVEAMVD